MHLTALRRAIAAFYAVVLGITTATTVELLTVTATTLAAATTTTVMVSVLCVPVLNKVNYLL